MCCWRYLIHNPKEKTNSCINKGRGIKLNNNPRGTGSNGIVFPRKSLWAVPAPSKVRPHSYSYRVALNVIPCKENLARRGIHTLARECDLCQPVVESMNLFFRVPLVLSGVVCEAVGYADIGNSM